MPIINNNPPITHKAYIPKAANKSALGASTTNAAKSANTPNGAVSIMISIIFKMTSLKPSKNFFTGSACSSGIKMSPIPKKIAKKITCNILALLPAAPTILLGTISTKACKGPASFCFSASWRFNSASPP